MEASSALTGWVRAASSICSTTQAQLRVHSTRAGCFSYSEENLTVAPSGVSSSTSSMLMLRVLSLERTEN
jgi:hypothetical protein